MMMAVDLLFKLLGAGYEFAAVVRVSSTNCTVPVGDPVPEADTECLSQMSRKAWLNVGSLFAGTLAFFVGTCLWWVARRLRRMIRAEDEMSRILLTVERPIKIHSPKPLAWWLVGALRTHDSVSARNSIATGSNATSTTSPHQ
eukprot:Protomagalhaensia_sp_Gyna_25__5389@NODE_695_length_2823_cov_1374_900503_g543_i0_p4_GENE_NODE_695_length_2823_cov_1374_900503_g543_i0NODE_695_length_2823_cov_1374_900503_g543_i0_p4_ORF_typecomplete_len143_score25_38_NODE_695_length_2823_cov_1374_900503_g543_i016732101